LVACYCFCCVEVDVRFDSSRKREIPGKLGASNVPLRRSSWWIHLVGVISRRPLIDK
jgi:hypothetical protein